MANAVALYQRKMLVAAAMVMVNGAVRLVRSDRFRGALTSRKATTIGLNAAKSDDKNAFASMFS